MSTWKALQPWEAICDRAACVYLHSKPSGQKPSGQKPSGQKPSGQEPSGQKPSGKIQFKPEHQLH